MRIIFVLILFLSFNLRSEKTPSVALTAGSEFLVEESVVKKSPTEQEYTLNTSVLKTEAQIKEENNLYQSKPSDDSLKLKIILPVALLIGISLFYINKKNKSDKQSIKMADIAPVNFEPEEKEELKKEMWNYIATQPVEEETFESSIETEPMDFTKHSYNCAQGQLVIEQVYAHPNKGEKVFLNGVIAPAGKYKIGLLSSVEVLNGKVI